MTNHPRSLSHRPALTRELMTDSGTAKTSPSVIGSSHQNRTCAYFQTTSAVTAPSTVCHLWICQAVCQLVPSSPRFCAFHPTDLPRRMSNTNLL